MSTDFTGPNGLAFSPDEKLLYVGNWDEKRKVVYRSPVNVVATLSKGELFFDMTSAAGEDAIEILSPEGKPQPARPADMDISAHLGTLHGPEHPHNMDWGGAGKRTLYLAAQTGIYRIHLNILGTSAFSKQS